jgi:hypothetical protein
MHRNPFSWRAAAIAAMDRHPAARERCRALAAELLLAEADEVARGNRHLTVVHGVPATPEERSQLDGFLKTADALLPVGAWTRRGDDDHVIVTVSGEGAEGRIAVLRAIADRCDPGHWRVGAHARPDLALRS